ncbi:5-oxoprolinase [Sphingopyxis macrogoltabida]|uniref:5-oxoprolinase n=1 Tax=Sphingopyxis macrogoltabida TaxID=33050 RepID=A0AAC8Z143_SPHMC|nr:5-oxoprolinase [Sphingopyxis macrogoltabida]AMU89948.1 5-oxoprolinase [Sphingopyxis macrogoltabida]
MGDKCTCCGGSEFLLESHGTGGLNDVCRPCFNIWYDCDVQCSRDECAGKAPHIHGEDVGAYNQTARAEGRYPFQPGSQFVTPNPDHPVSQIGREN